MHIFTLLIHARMLDHIRLNQLLVIDIETVPGLPEFASLNSALKDLWRIKAGHLGKKETDDEQEFYFNHAGIYAEFGKVICIVAGKFVADKEAETFKLKTIAGDNESELLRTFLSLIAAQSKKTNWQFAGHNVREFDVPYICRRALVNRLALPSLLDIAGKKQWDVQMADTLQLWRFGDFKHYTSLKLLMEILGLPSPKSDIDGKDVGRVYWKEKDLNRITEYCRRDVVAVARLIQHFKGMKPVADSAVIEV